MDAQKYGYLTVGDTVRIFVFKELNSPLHTLVCRKLEYKIHVISQNSRKKDIAEDEGSNVLYCMHSTLQFVARSKKKDAPCCKGTDQHVRLRSKMAF